MKLDEILFNSYNSRHPDRYKVAASVMAHYCKPVTGYRISQPTSSVLRICDGDLVLQHNLYIRSNM